jgi:DNA-binding transcriptional regulator GbsR (MarR family)
LHGNSKISLQFQTGLQKLCQLKTTKEVDITFTDFQAALKDIKNNAAPGLSRPTANMVKSWSAATQFSVFKHMNYLWLKRAISSLMKNKVIQLAPKVPGSSDIKNIRPISLCKVFRKI